MANAIERYVELASGVTSITVQAAERLVQRLVKEGEVAADRAERAVSEVLDASQRNRQALAELVRHEVERTVDRLNLVRRSDLEELEQRLLLAMRSPTSAGATTAAKRAATAKKTAAAQGMKRQGAQTAGADTDATATPTARTAGTARKKAAVSKTSAKKSTTKAAKKSSAKKSSAKKSSPRKGTAAKKAAAEQARGARGADS